MVTSAEVLHLLLFCLICCLNSKDDSIKHDSDIVHTSLVHYITACVCAREPWYILSNSLSYHFFNCASVAQRMLDSWVAGWQCSQPKPKLAGLGGTKEASCCCCCLAWPDQSKTLPGTASSNPESHTEILLMPLPHPAVPPTTACT